MKKEQIENIVKNYFGNSQYHLSVSMVWQIACMSISYTDFKPENEVITHLLSTIPMAHIDIIERSYSNKAKVDVLRDIVENGNVSVTINNDADTYRDVPLSVYIEEILFSKEL